MRLILSVIAFIIWLIIGYFTKPCFDAHFECEGAVTTENGANDANPENQTTTLLDKANGPLLFNWDKADATIGDGWDAQKQALIDGLKENEILEITGQYRAEEVNGTSYKNLGIARAHEIANLFKPPLTDDQMALEGILVNGEESDKTSPFRSATFRNLKNSKVLKETADGMLIYFPFNSYYKLNNAEVEAYLDDVAERVKASGERILLTGHTDNVDSEEYNQKLGFERANVVKTYLLSKGLTSSQIMVESLGESKPLEDNSTSEGRAKNRRTELKIIK